MQLGYDMMTVGNHEFNFGLKNLNRARADAQFPVDFGQHRGGAGQSAKPFAPYFVKTVAGVKVAVIGITTPSVPQLGKAGELRRLPFPARRGGAEERRWRRCAVANIPTWCWPPCTPAWTAIPKTG